MPQGLDSPFCHQNWVLLALDILLQIHSTHNSPRPLAYSLLWQQVVGMNLWFFFELNPRNSQNTNRSLLLFLQQTRLLSGPGTTPLLEWTHTRTSIHSHSHSHTVTHSPFWGICLVLTFPKGDRLCELSGDLPAWVPGLLEQKAVILSEDVPMLEIILS